MGFQPKPARQIDGLETGFRPPVRFLTRPVQFAMVCPAQRYCEFVADLEAEAAGLREPQMVGIAGLPPADQAGLIGDKPEMGLVARATPSASRPWCPLRVSVSSRLTRSTTL